MLKGVSEARFLGWKISLLGELTLFFFLEGNTTEKPLGTQDLLQAECFPAEPETTTVLPNGNSVFTTSLHSLLRIKEGFMFFCLTEALIFPKKHDICLSAFQLILFCGEILSR